MEKTMEFFWVDHTELKDKPQLLNYDHLIEVFQAKRLPPEVPTILSEVTPGTFLVHAGKENNTQQDWEKIANPKKKRFIIFVSSSPAGLNSTTDGVHCVKHYLAQIIPLLTSEKVDQLKKSLAAGKPNWELIKPPPYPEYLVAAYLVQVAAQKGFSINPEESGCSDFWKKAEEEYTQRTVTGQPPEFTPNGDPSRLRQVLKNIAS